MKIPRCPSWLCGLFGHFPDQSISFASEPGQKPPALCAACHTVVHKYKIRVPYWFVGIDGSVTAKWLRKRGILSDHSKNT